jgi:hypothetical protein
LKGYATMIAIPQRWNSAGLILGRNAAQTGGVVGDPCIVWDAAITGWRMFLFVDKPGVGEAICLDRHSVGPGQWQYLGGLTFTNPEQILGGYTHKPFVVQDAYQPNRAALIEGRYYLVTVSRSRLNGQFHKVIQLATSASLAGPWTLHEGPLIGLGGPSDFDAKHTDAVSGFYFADRGEILYYYMGYPEIAQEEQPLSPFGSCSSTAVQRVGESQATKLNVVLRPENTAGHWASGYVGGIQLLPGKNHRWVGLANASPTPPDPHNPDKSREEPPPSLGGFAYCDEAWPVNNWHWCPEPIEWIEDPSSARLAAGEGVNLWRHHVLALPDGRLAIYYNTGSYGTEQLYMKLAEESTAVIPK